MYEAVLATWQGRSRCDLYHSALEVRVPEGRFVIEQTPVPDDAGARRGVVAGGAVGTRWTGRLRVFRYEIRCWRDGTIPDADAAVGRPMRVSDDVACARRVLDVVPAVPTPVWGRDELRTGEMWNSNSVIAWVLARAVSIRRRCSHHRGAERPGGTPDASSPSAALKWSARMERVTGIEPASSAWKNESVPLADLPVSRNRWSATFI